MFQARHLPLTNFAGMAFMAQDGWKSGLTAVQLSKVEALQTDCERLQKEAAQRKLMVENQEQELERQKRKVGDMRVTYTVHCFEIKQLVFQMWFSLSVLIRAIIHASGVDFIPSRKFHTVSFFKLKFVAP